jgi:hypothetical protein
VAEVSVETVTQMVGDRVAKMGPSEARGYIRGRAGRAIRRYTRLAVARHAVAEASWENAVAVRASDRVAPLVMRQLTLAAQRAEATRRIA